ncbi:MAG: methyltransferase domain-containing protein [Acidobacteriota bacterium]
MAEAQRPRAETGPNQDAIWDYFQNEAPQSFSGSRGRLTYLTRLIDPNEKVLNIGVGDGAFEAAAIKRGLDVWSLDPNEKSMNALRERFGMGRKARTGYAQAIPFADRSFAVVVLSEVVEHLSGVILESALDEIARVLAPGGRLIGTVPARENLAEQTVVCPDCGKRFHRWGHTQSFDPARVRELLSRNFIDISAWERPFVTWSALNWKGKLHASIQMLLYSLGIHGQHESVVFIAHKPPV